MTYTASVYIHSVKLEPPGGPFTVCDHDTVVITCTLSSSQTLWWTLTDVKNASVFEQEQFISLSSLQQGKMLGDFVLRLKSTSPLVSTATLNDTDTKHNGTLLTCANTNAYPPPEEFAGITILVKGISSLWFA